MTSGLKSKQLVDTFHRFAVRCGFLSMVKLDSGPTSQKSSKILKANWKFGPLCSPHPQGLVEAAIKPAKRSLFKVAKGCMLTFEVNAVFA